LTAQDVVIRQTVPDDLAALSDLACRVYAATFGHALSEAELAAALQETKSEAYFQSVIDTDAILIALDGDLPIGYVQICEMVLPVESAVPGSQQLNALYVDPAFHGKGVGKALLEAALALPRVRDGHTLYLDVWEENRRALSFYRRNGFEPVGYCDVVIDGTVIGQDLAMARRV